MKFMHAVVAASGFCGGVGLGATPGCFPTCTGDPQLSSGTYVVAAVRSGTARTPNASERWANVPLVKGGVVVYTEYEEMRLVYTPPSGVETSVTFRY
jgi:hypothetical protein